MSDDKKNPTLNNTTSDKQPQPASTPPAPQKTGYNEKSIKPSDYQHKR